MKNKNLKEALTSNSGGGVMGLLDSPVNEIEKGIKDLKKITYKKEKAKEKEISLVESRLTLIIREDLYKKVKVMAHWELTSMKEIVNNALEKAVKDYEKTHGEIINMPKSKKNSRTV